MIVVGIAVARIVAAGKGGDRLAQDFQIIGSDTASWIASALTTLTGTATWSGEAGRGEPVTAICSAGGVSPVLRQRRNSEIAGDDVAKSASMLMLTLLFMILLSI